MSTAEILDYPDDASPELNAENAEVIDLRERIADSEEPPAKRVEPDVLPTNLVDQYLMEIGRTPLLTHEEEVHHAKTYEAGREAEKILARLAKDKKARPGKRYLSRLNQITSLGEASKEQLTNANLRLVVSIAKKYQGNGIDMLDLIQQGNLGLLRAVEKFDYRRGYKFSTYATWWVKQAVGRLVDTKSRIIHLPVEKAYMVRRYQTTFGYLSADLGRDPTNQEMAQELGMSEETIAELKSYAQSVLSLNSPVGEDGKAEFGDFIKDRDSVSTEEGALKTLANQKLVQTARKLLDDRHFAVIVLRYGLNDGISRSLQEVGVELGLSRETIRNMEAHAFETLREFGDIAH